MGKRLSYHIYEINELRGYFLITIKIENGLFELNDDRIIFCLKH